MLNFIIESEQGMRESKKNFFYFIKKANLFLACF